MHHFVTRAVRAPLAMATALDHSDHFALRASRVLCDHFVTHAVRAPRALRAMATALDHSDHFDHSVTHAVRASIASLRALNHLAQLASRFSEKFWRSPQLL